MDTQLHLESAQGMAAQHPDTFGVTSIDGLKKNLKPGIYAKICVLDDGGERIWTLITSIHRNKITATFANDPLSTRFKFGDKIIYQFHHVYDWMEKE